MQTSAKTTSGRRSRSARRAGPRVARYSGLKMYPMWAAAQATLQNPKTTATAAGDFCCSSLDATFYILAHTQTHLIVVLSLSFLIPPPASRSPYLCIFSLSSHDFYIRKMPAQHSSIYLTVYLSLSILSLFSVLHMIN